MCDSIGDHAASGKNAGTLVITFSASPKTSAKLSRAKRVCETGRATSSSVPVIKVGLITLVGRKTQLSKITKLPRATARATQKAAVRRLEPIGDFVHTITSTTERNSPRIRTSPMH